MAHRGAAIASGMLNDGRPPLWRAQCGDQEQKWVSPPTTMRPFTAMGEVHSRTPEQLSLPPAKMTLPVSPSTPVSFPLLMYQTTVSEVPSVVVVIGAVTGPASVAHHSTWGFGG